MDRKFFYKKWDAENKYFFSPVLASEKYYFHFYRIISDRSVLQMLININLSLS